MKGSESIKCLALFLTCIVDSKIKVLLLLVNVIKDSCNDNKVGIVTSNFQLKFYPLFVFILACIYINERNSVIKFDKHKELFVTYCILQLPNPVSDCLLDT